MRLSAIRHPPNRYVTSIHFGATAYKKLQELEEATGMNRSAIIRTLVMAAKVNRVATLAAKSDEPTTTVSL